MNKRTTILALAALTATSLSMLAPTSASAWGGYGHGGNYQSGGNFGGHRPMNYFGSHRLGSPWGPRSGPVTYPTQNYGPAVTYARSPFVRRRTESFFPRPAPESCENPEAQFEAQGWRQPYQDRKSTELQK